MKKCKIAKWRFQAERKCHYSGKNSASFWRRVNRLKNPEEKLACYSLGVVLQNLEGWVLQQLENAEQEERWERRKAKP